MPVECRSDWVGWSGSFWSGSRDLNSRPLDPQIGELVVSCAPEPRFTDWGDGCDRHVIAH